MSLRHTFGQNICLNIPADVGGGNAGKTFARDGLVFGLSGAEYIFVLLAVDGGEQMVVAFVGRLYAGVASYYKWGVSYSPIMWLKLHEIINRTKVLRIDQKS